MVGYTCDVCNKYFDDNEKELTEDENKCILHCKKDKYSKSIEKLFESEIEQYMKANINEDNKLNLLDIFFPNYFNYELLLNFSNSITFCNCNFNKENKKIQLFFNDELEVYFNDCNFHKEWTHWNIQNIQYSTCDFHNILSFPKTEKSKTNKIYQIMLDSCNIYEMFDLDFLAINYNSCKINELNLANSIFHKKVEIKDCNVNNTILYGVRFKEFCDFEDTEFKKLIFKNTVFEKLVTFQKTTFVKNVDFNYVTFKEHSIFKKSVFKNKVNFENTLFEKNGSFYGITLEKDKIIDIEVKNRETARIIKDSFEKDNNIIEANRFYKLEMIEREKELYSKEKNNWFERLIFNIHRISSNHSQDALLSLFWIISLTFVYSHLKTFTEQPCTEYYTIPVILSFLIIIYNFCEIFEYKKLSIGMMTSISFASYLIYTFLTLDYKLYEFSNNLNPFAIMTGDDELNFTNLVYRALMAYLIYQFIVSVRQNTRRK